MHRLTTWAGWRLLVRWSLLRWSFRAVSSLLHCDHCRASSFAHVASSFARVVAPPLALIPSPLPPLDRVAVAKVLLKLLDCAVHSALRSPLARASLSIMKWGAFLTDKSDIFCLNRLSHRTHVETFCAVALAPLLSSLQTTDNDHCPAAAATKAHRSKDATHCISVSFFWGRLSFLSSNSC